MGWQAAIETTVTGLGYEVVDTERGPRGLLRVTIDRLPGDPTGEFITVEDCEKVTRQLQHVLEVEGGDYERLEVSSPGLDRPLRTPAHFARFVGQHIDLTLKMPFQGRKRYSGLLLAGASNGGAAVSQETPSGTAGSAWRIVLDAPVVAKPGVKKPSGKTAATTSRAAKPPKPAKAPAGESAGQALDFGFDEVREARLVPVVDFKGRRFDVPPVAADATDREVERPVMELQTK